MIDVNLNPDLNPDLKKPDAPPAEVTAEEPPVPLYDRDKFFSAVREDPFGGNLTQDQVDGMEAILGTWEKYFAPNNPNDGTDWLAYCLATTFHETAQTMQPISEFGEGQGYPYGEPAGPYGNRYFGRGLVQITWEQNYLNGEAMLRDKYGLDYPIHQYPDKALEYEPAALLLMDGSVFGMFTGVSLQDYFNKANGIYDPYNARRVINGTDKADLLRSYHEAFKKALIETVV